MKLITAVRWKVLVVAGIACLVFAGCSSGDSARPPEGPLRIVTAKNVALVPYGSCAELESEVKVILIAAMEERLNWLEYWCDYEYGNEGEGAEDAFAASGDAERVGATGTNLQEIGVDEADLIKTDGTYVYAIMGERVRIARVWPFEEFGEASSIEPEGTPEGIYLKGNRLIIISRVPDPYEPEYTPNYNSPYTGTVVSEIYDVSDPASPSFVTVQKYPGELIDSRMIGARLHMMIGSRIESPELDYASPCGNIAMLRKKNLETIETLNIAEMLPTAESDSYILCNQIYRTMDVRGIGLITVVTDDVDDSGGALASISVMGNGGTVYTSPNSIFVASRSNEWWLQESDDNVEATVIHRFGLEGDLPQYTGSGAIAGHLLDNQYVGSRGSSRFSMAQFAMSEHEGHLRVATTTGGLSPWDDTDSESQVTILDVTGSLFSVIGGVGGLGKGERIYSVRFSDDRGYVVTFKKVDPLYVLDLSDPADARSIGELKMPGFSTYLHQIDEGHLIGLGFDTDDQGSFAWTQGLKLSLFDVSNPEHPKEVGNRVIGSRGSYSPAVEEHHAFTFDPDRMLIALPVELFTGSDGGSQLGQYAGSLVMIIHVDQFGNFESIGEIEFASSEGGDYWQQWRDTTVLRTIIIGEGINDGVITLTNTGLALHRIDGDMNEIGMFE